MAKKKIAIVGAGAVGAYAGAHMVQAGEDVTYIDPWPENVEAIRGDGLRVTHIRDVEARRAAGKSGSRHTVSRVGEVHGRITDRAKEVCALVANADSAMVTENLWGERWSKLVTNVMGNGLSACTGMIGRDIVKNDVMRHFSNRLGSEAIRVGQALGYTFDEVSHMDPETLARAGEGDPAAQKEIDEHRLAVANSGGGEHRPSTGQDMVKGRRTEIPFLNGYVVRKGEEVGIPAPTNAILTDIVRRVEIGELKPDPKHITDLRLN